ncbi:MAG TPA: PKD domain-containing protein [Flavobacteriales bacterium]|nr:PKD domain-containing protein [Flavobacteriales bacterium]
MKKLFLFITIFCAGRAIAQPPPNMTCATALNACNGDTSFFQCCFIPSCSPTTFEVDQWYEFCVNAPMNAVQTIEFHSQFGFRGWTLYGPLSTTANCTAAVPANIYSTSSVAIAPSPYTFVGLPAGKYILHLRVNECYGWVTPNYIGFDSECLECAPSCYPVTMPELTACSNQPVSVTVSSCKGGNATAQIDFNDGPLQSGPVSWLSGPAPVTFTGTHTYTTPGTYIITVNVIVGSTVIETTTATITIIDCDIPCEHCIGSFAPTPGKYLFSAWVKEKNALLSKTSYTFPQVTLDFPSFSTVGPFGASGQIIDGWQRIEKEFIVPTGATQMDIMLDCTTGDCYFDDIRIFPFDGSMKSYVYDPVTLRLVAELDERNYATMYEYDEEGKLTRIKKETEKGIMTIQESKTTVVKK